ncbi:MAG: AI-2E family transporter [Anaerolineales bacterium]|nr:AI-2E family transporter [Anaerolineales bacterium]
MTKQWNLSLRYWILSILAILFVGLLWFARELMSPLVVGALLAFVLNPAIGFVTHHTRLSRSWAATIVLFTGLGGLIALSALMVPRLIVEIQVLFLDLQEILSQIQESLAQPVIFLDWVFHFEHLMPDLTRLLSESITTIPESAFHLLEATSKNLIWGLVILATVFYLLRDWAQLRNWFFALTPKSYQTDAKRIYVEIKQIWQGYLRGNIALMVIVGIMFTLAWLAIGLPGALILGLITGLLTIIPDLGPAIAAILAAIVALFEGSTYLDISNFWFAVLVIGIYLLLINIKGIWIRPRIFARSVHMHDGVVFIAIMAAVVLQGILGALIIVPVLASVGVLGRYIYHQLMGSSPWPPDELGETTNE